MLSALGSDGKSGRSDRKILTETCAKNGKISTKPSALRQKTIKQRTDRVENKLRKPAL